MFPPMAVKVGPQLRGVRRINGLEFDENGYSTCAIDTNTLAIFKAQGQDFELIPMHNPQDEIEIGQLRANITDLQKQRAAYRDEVTVLREQLAKAQGGGKR